MPPKRAKPEDAADTASATSPADQATSTGAADAATATDIQSEGSADSLNGGDTGQAEERDAATEVASTAEGAQASSASDPADADAALDALAAVLDGPNPLTRQPSSLGFADPQILHITAKQPSRWRAGLNFTSEGRSIPLADLTEAQLDLIANDPLLHVELR